MPMDRGFQKTPPFENSADKGNFKRWETLVIYIYNISKKARFGYAQKLTGTTGTGTEMN